MKCLIEISGGFAYGYLRSVTTYNQAMNLDDSERR